MEYRKRHEVHRRSNVMRILLVEDSAVVRNALREMISGIDGAAVAGEFDSPAPAIESIRTNPPHVVVLDIQLVGGSGLEVLRAVSKEHPQVKVIVFTNFAEPVYRKRCRDAGAHAFFDKKSDLQALRRTLQALVSESGNG
jgi:DNA-binding NarL/FixJ family response regulator